MRKWNAYVLDFYVFEITNPSFNVSNEDFDVCKVDYTPLAYLLLYLDGPYEHPTDSSSLFIKYSVTQYDNLQML
eukprot:snap_masked-scaffold_6-processed-gene-8.38-mRNA-1 protein AED:1.00 eAED:1.00 QI:0/-1/0/0/-1/1/1/0/73